MSAPPRFLFVAAPAAAAAALAAVRRAGPVSAQLAPTADALRATLDEGGAQWDAVVLVPGGPVDEVEAALYVPDGVPLVVVDGEEALLLTDDGARGIPLSDLPTLRTGPVAAPAGDGWASTDEDPYERAVLTWSDAPVATSSSAPVVFWTPPSGDGFAGGNPIPLAPPLSQADHSGAADSSAAGAPKGAPAPDAGGDRPAVLVVEDNGDTRMLLERILRSAYDVTAVGDARSALLAMNERRFNGLILDINLGGKETGADVLRIARSLAGYEDVYAIALTAYALPGDRERLLEAGFSDYISKPFTRQSLMDVLAAGVAA